MKRLLTICVLVIALLCVTGCGNVYLRGEAITAAETSAIDAYQATIRAAAEPTTAEWLRAYLDENFKQWRFFVRSAHNDEAWGPKLEGE